MARTKVASRLTDELTVGLEVLGQRVDVVALLNNQSLEHLVVAAGRLLLSDLHQHEAGGDVGQVLAHFPQHLVQEMEVAVVVLGHLLWAGQLEACP